jgi:hypothetical protein
MEVRMNGSNELAAGVDGLIEEGEAFRRVRARAASAVRLSSARSTRVFHTGMAVAFLVTTFAGFAPTYFLRGLSNRVPLSPLLHVHGLVFTAWLLLLLVQTALVAGHQVAWHRRLGIAGALLAAAMIPLGVMVAIAGARRGFATGATESLVFLIFPLGQMLLFAACVGAAMRARRKPEIHRRLFMLATILVVTPAISRLPFVPNPMVAIVLSELFVIAGMVHDWKSRGRVHPVYIWGGFVMLVSGPVRFALGHTDAWQAFARFLVR